MRKKGDALSNLGSCLQVLPYHPFQGRTCDVKRLGQLSFIHFPAGVRVCCGAAKIFMGNKSSPLCTFLKVRVCVAMKAPVGLLSDRTVLRSKMEGPRPDKFTLPWLDFCGNLFQQFNITYLLRVPARLPKEPEQVFNFLIAT